jgi:hypothetical protein
MRFAHSGTGSDAQYVQADRGIQAPAAFSQLVAASSLVSRRRSRSTTAVCGHDSYLPGWSPVKQVRRLRESPPRTRRVPGPLDEIWPTTRLLAP